jgi:hypothetical protein
MPRGRRNNQPPTMTLDEFTDIIEDENHIFQVKVMFVKDHLKNQMWDLLKETNKKTECPVCLEEICCKTCYTIGICGHAGHLSCLLKCKTCPVCRA